jgi:hypothetical protein
VRPPRAWAGPGTAARLRVRYGNAVSVLETALVYGAIPAGIVAVLALLVFGPSLARSPRYRPGRPWDYDPVWYIPHPEERPPAEVGGPRQLGVGSTAELPGTVGEPVDTHPPASVLDEVTTAKGGAHGSW